MKIVLLHGDHYVKSYERLLKFISVAKSRGWEIQRVTNKNIDVSEALSAQSLFEKNKLVVVEDTKLLIKKDIDWINKRKNDIDSTLIIYHKNLLSKTSLSKLPKIDKIEEYKLPKLIWTFLDSFFPGNANNCLALLHDILKHEPVEFAFSLLSRRVVDIYLLKLNSNDESFSAWLRGKILRQSSRFDCEVIENILNQMGEVDIKVKSSKEKLIDMLDLLIIQELG